MIRIFHVSDVHFGAEDTQAIAWFAQRVANEKPDAIIVTGDLTFRARAHEFDAAREWLISLNRPIVLSPGNHDLPYFNPFKRFGTPYKRFAQVAALAETELDLPNVAVIPFDTTAAFQWRWNWADGHVSAKRLERCIDAVRAVPPEHVIIVACHHPLVQGEISESSKTTNGSNALQALAAAGANAIVSGHVHTPFSMVRTIGGQSVHLIGAGTLSERIRGTPQSFNEIRVIETKMHVSVHDRT